MIFNSYSILINLKNLRALPKAGLVADRHLFGKIPWALIFLPVEAFIKFSYWESSFKKTVYNR